MLILAHEVDLLCKVKLIKGWFPFPIQLTQGQEFEGSLNIWREVWWGQEVHMESGYHRLDPP